MAKDSATEYGHSLAPPPSADEVAYGARSPLKLSPGAIAFGEGLGGTRMATDAGGIGNSLESSNQFLLSGHNENLKLLEDLRFIQELKIYLDSEVA